MKRIGCVLRAIKHWLKYGIYSGHIYVLDKTICGNVFYTAHGFRISENNMHTSDERMAADAYIEISRCKYCGREDISWIRKENYRGGIE